MSASTRIGQAAQSGAVSPKVTVWISIPFILVAAIVGLRSLAKQNNLRARADWKAATLPRLAALSITNDQIHQELDELKADASPKMNWGWAHDHVLLMTNGDFLIYAFRHGFNSGTVDHLFVAHGSDGRWWYSTYHFCNHMVGVRSDDPPGSIAEFAKRYSVREFDGKSDECLRKTWPLKSGG